MGGIFLGIDYNKTEKAFIDLGVINFPELYTQHKASTMFEDLETGKILPAEFYKKLCEKAGMELSAEQIDTAWNAMLGDFSANTLQWLEEVAKKFNIYLFSNTNLIHYKAFQQIFQQQTGKKSFDDYFLKAYYSHDLGLRKPYMEAFLKILELENLVAEETLFIDDTPGNIKGAEQAGLHTLLLLPPKTVLELDL